MTMNICGGETFMLYTSEINKALKLISEVHKNQVDKAGVAYILHPFIVAENAMNFCYKFSADIEKVNKSQILEDIIVSALLHDVVEDSKSAEELASGLNKLRLFEKFTIDRITDQYVRLKSTNPFGSIHYFKAYYDETE